MGGLSKFEESRSAGAVSLLRLDGGEWEGEVLGDRNIQMLLGATEAAMSIIEGFLSANLLLVRKKHFIGFGISVLGVNSNSLDF